MPDGQRRSREGWADTMEAGPANPPAHVHRLPKAVRLAMVGLTAAVFLLLVALGLMAVYVYQANQYVQGRGEFRDAEASRLQQQSEELSRKTACDILDALPVSPLLDRVRLQFGCGPGIPLEDLTPREREQISGRAEPTTAPRVTPSSTPSGAASDPMAGARAPSQSPSSPSSPSPAPTTPTASSPPPPLVDLGRAVKPFCDAAIVCF